VTDDLSFAPATELAARIRARELSSRELTEHVLARIEAHDGELNAFTMVFADRALAEAEAKDAETLAGGDLPPLHGVPAGIKELALLAGAPATFGSRAFAENLVDVDAHHVARLKAAGVVVVGKTNAPEFGSTPYTDPVLYGSTRNPWDLTRTPGGSSGGSGAALAAGLVPIADASDGGGSSRIPASACGLLGLKPSRFRISNGPLASSLAMDLASAGPIGRTVADVGRLLDAMHGYEPGDAGTAPPPSAPFARLATQPPGRLRVGVVRSLPHVGYSAPVSAALDRAVALVTDAGHDAFDVDIEVPAHVIEAFRGMWAALQAMFPVPPEAMEPHNAYYARQGAALTGGQVYGAEFGLGAYVRGLVARFHGEFDVLLAPVLTDLPPEVGATTAREPEAMWDHATDLVGITPIFNATGQPALSLPVHVDPASGLPVGVQVAGRYGDEATLLQLATQLEPVVGWADARPPFPG
jgi:amidase